MENKLFQGPMHQDAHEFLNFLLNKIVEDLSGEGYAGVMLGNGHGKEDCEFRSPFLVVLPARLERSDSYN